MRTRMRMPIPILMIIGLLLGLTFLVMALYAQPPSAQQLPQAYAYALLGAAAAISIPGAAAALAMGTASAAAIGALAEKPEVFSKTLIYIVFIEAIAIYGLVVAFMILLKVP